LEPSILLRSESWQIVLFLFFAMLVLIVLGLYVGKKYYRAFEKEATLQGALFAILGLLLAFTFSMSVSRYDKRIEIIIEESNDIGTAILRADLYPEPERQLFRDDFKRYVEARIAFFDAGADLKEVNSTRNEAAAISQQLWDRATRLSADPRVTSVASMQMIPALNAMIDIASTRWHMSLARVPEPVLYLLFILICICSFYTGFILSGKKQLDWLGIIGFCLVICTIVHLIIDIDRPRRGMISMKQTSQAITELKQMFE
jgi:hypothetical protein